MSPNPPLVMPSVRLLSAAVEQLLRGHGNLQVFVSEVDPSLAVDQNGAAKGYAVLHPGTGDADSSSLTRAPGRLLWQFQVTCGGGTAEYWGWAVDAVRSVLDGKSLAVAGAVVGKLQPPFGFQPPPPQPNTSVNPSRLTSPLIYQVLAVPA